LVYLTIFTLPKPFTDPHVRLIQSNALASWSHLGPEVEVLVIGDDEGVGEAAKTHGAEHIGGAEVNAYGTPQLNWAFREAASRGSGKLMCYVNADIVLLPDFMAALRRMPPRPFIALGQRWNCDVREPLDFAKDGAELRSWARINGELDARRGSDYFVYPRLADLGLPAFAVGRPGWDNWLIGHALEIGLHVIDLTPSVTVIHQNHDYVHVAARRSSDWEGPEADRNRELAGSLDRYMHTPANATHLLTPVGLRRARTPSHMRARAEAYLSLNPKASPVRRMVRRIRSNQPS
jgi:hypothetical protein